jgi:hypothetical protein
MVIENHTFLIAVETVNPVRVEFQGEALSGFVPILAASYLRIVLSVAYGLV